MINTTTQDVTTSVGQVSKARREVRRSSLHDNILRAFKTFGPMTVAELCRIRGLELFGNGTVGKRVSELKEMGLVGINGQRGRSKIYRAVG